MVRRSTLIITLVACKVKNNNDIAQKTPNMMNILILCKEYVQDNIGAFKVERRNYTRRDS